MDPEIDENNTDKKLVEGETEEPKEEETLKPGEQTEEQKIDEEEKLFRPYKIMLYLCFAILGLVNNTGLVLIISCTKQFGKALNNESLIALYPVSLNLFNFLSRMINSRVCLTLKYKTRLLLISSYFLFGYLFMFLTLRLNDSIDINPIVIFIMSLIPAIVMGTGQAFGEANILGYLRNFPKPYMKGWSTGTGLAGIFGAGTTLLFKVYDIHTMYLYLFLSPIIVVYFFAFYYSFKVLEKVNNLKIANASSLNLNRTTIADKENNNNNNDDNLDNEREREHNDDDNENPNKEGEVEVAKTNQDDVANNKKLNCQNFKVAFGKGKKFILCLCFVYHFQYAIQTGLAERTSSLGYIHQLEDYLYEIFCLCYQAGVFVSRSSLEIVKHVKFVQIFTILQGCNYIFWFIEACTGFCTSVGVLFADLVFVGLMGGSSYVGNMYYLLNNDDIEQVYKELCMGICTMFNDFGILSSQLSVLVFDMTFLKKPDDK